MRSPTLLLAIGLMTGISSLAAATAEAESTRPAELSSAGTPVGETTTDQPAGLDGSWIVDFEQAKRLAAKHDVPILADFTGSDWCGWCIKLNKEVFDTEAFQQWATDRIVLLKLDFPMRKEQDQAIAKQNQGLQSKYQVRGYPTILLLDQEGQVLRRGGYAPGGFKAWVASLIGEEDSLQHLRP